MAPRPQRGGIVGYAIAAYSIVIGSLVAYGLWIAVQRRALRRLEERRRGGNPERR